MLLIKMDFCYFRYVIMGMPLNYFSPAKKKNQKPLAFNK